MKEREKKAGESADVEPIYRAVCEAGGIYDDQTLKLMGFTTRDGIYFYIISTGAKKSRISVRLHPDTDTALLDKLSAYGTVEPEFAVHSNMRMFPQRQNSPGSAESPYSRQVIVHGLENLKKVIRILNGETVSESPAHEETPEESAAESTPPSSETERKTDGVLVTEGRAEVKIRIGQSDLRKRLLKKVGPMCELTGIRNERLLWVSHIKPWAQSDSKEQVDIENVLLLSPSADSLFDLGYITFDDEGRMLAAPEITDEDLKLLGITPGARLRTPVSADKRGYLAYHRAYVFGKFRSK
jgi:hypothetical protein